ncbi:MAG: hypothetical protein H6Q42_2463 [Deltaproteobacteria bacterium]|jgi:hypothetical protein|nr:hypothetical protein [Deltaproteobacteria bacterium]
MYLFFDAFSLHSLQVSIPKSRGIPGKARGISFIEDASVYSGGHFRLAENKELMPPSERVMNMMIFYISPGSQVLSLGKNMRIITNSAIIQRKGIEP